MLTKTEKAFNVIFGIWWCLGAAFFILSIAFMQWGGALEGKVDHGHYFTAKGSHFFEVSKSIFIVGVTLEIIWLASMAALAVSYALVAVEKGDPFWINTEWASQKKGRF